MSEPMSVIYKQQLKGVEINGAPMRFVIRKDAQILSIQLQNDIPTMWFLTTEEPAWGSVEESRPIETKTIVCVGTGAYFNSSGHLYLGTVQLRGLVYHYFQIYTP